MFAGCVQPFKFLIEHLANPEGLAGEVKSLTQATKHYYSTRQGPLEIAPTAAVLLELKIGDPEAVKNRVVYWDSLSVITGGPEVERIP